MLAAVLAAEPDLTKALTIAEALDRLLDIDPPYPPADDPDAPIAPEVGIPAAIGVLNDAVGADTSIQDLFRYGETLILLREVLDGRGTPTAVTS